MTSVFIRFRDKLRGMAARIVGSGEEADDALHDAFCKLWSSNRDVNSETDAIKLTYAAVRNSAIDMVRYRKSHPLIPEDYAPEFFSETGCDEDKEKEELCKALIAMSRKVLNERQYRIFILHDVENLSYPDIAVKLGLTQENVRTILSRARKVIKDIYRNKIK